MGQGRGHPGQGTPKKTKAASERCSHRTYAPGWGLQWGSSPLGLEEEEPPSPGGPWGSGVKGHEVGPVCVWEQL